MLQNTGKQLEILDIDIILASETASRIRFETIKEQSDSNEYYEVSTTDQDAHLIIETVNGFNQWAGFSERSCCNGARCV